MIKVGVLGAGTMGSGIAQVAATSGHPVVLVDVNESQLDKAKKSLASVFSRLVEKGKYTQEQADTVFRRIEFSGTMNDFAGSGMVIEAIVENIKIKNTVFENLETIVDQSCILATNTSSLSVASIGAVLKNPERVIGIHFFNPAPLMPLVEIIPAVQTSNEVLTKSKELIDSWGKVTVLTKDTPGFIVNRVARSFYGEALRIYEEGIADFATIDWAMTELGWIQNGTVYLDGLHWKRCQLYSNRNRFCGILL
jgi:3-hydroxybutyryl-CoA dehydrogenase